MSNENKKQLEEALAEMYRNAELALTSISDILPAVKDEEIKNELYRQHEAYENFSARASQLAQDRGVEVKEPNPMKKAMMWSSIKMSTLSDDSPSHIAEMMVQGTVMGITALKRTAGEVYFDETEEVGALLQEMIKTEEEFENKWKQYL